MATGAGPHLPVEMPTATRQEVGDIKGFEKKHDQTHRGADAEARKTAEDRVGGTQTSGWMRRNENL